MNLEFLLFDSFYLFFLSFLFQTFENREIQNSFFPHPLRESLTTRSNIQIFLLGLLIIGHNLLPPVASGGIIFLILCLHLDFFLRSPINIFGSCDSLHFLILLYYLILHLAPVSIFTKGLEMYLIFQVCASYLLAGYVKLKEQKWCQGSALIEFLSLNKYSSPKSIYNLFNKIPTFSIIVSWLIMLFELLFPLAVLKPNILPFFLFIGAFFHLANAVIFGLHRFFWVWISTYPLIYKFSLSLDLPSFIFFNF